MVAYCNRKRNGFSGGYTIVKDYVRSKKRGSREMFVPLSHPAGHAQADFGEALVVIGGVERKAYFLAFDLPHSDACYIPCLPCGEHRGLAGRTCSCVCVLRGGSMVDPLR